MAGHDPSRLIDELDLAPAVVLGKSLDGVSACPGVGHAIHDDDPEGFALAVASFLAEL